MTTDCNACLIGPEPDGCCEVFEVTKVKKSRKVHKCFECYAVIPIGSPYESTFSVYEGDAQRVATCVICAEVRDAYYCADNSIAMGGRLWEDIAEEDFWMKFNTACLSKLKTPEAKAFMLKKWQEWRGLSTAVIPQAQGGAL